MRTVLLILLVSCIMFSCQTSNVDNNAGVNYILLTEPDESPSNFKDYSVQQLLDCIVDFGKSKPDSNTLYISDFYINTDMYADTAVFMIIYFSDRLGRDHEFQDDIILAESLLIKEMKRKPVVGLSRYIYASDIVRVYGGGIYKSKAVSSRKYSNPYYITSIFPEQGGKLDTIQTYYDLVSNRDIIDVIFPGNRKAGEYTDTAYLETIEIFDERVVDLQEGNTYIDSSFVVFVSYNPAPKRDFYGLERDIKYDLYILEITAGKLKQVASMYLGEYNSWDHGGISKVESLKMALYQLTDSAMGIGIYHSYNKGSEAGIKETEELDLYILKNDIFHQVLHLDLDDSESEQIYDNEKDEWSYKSYSWDGEIGVSKATINGFYKIIFFRSFEKEQDGYSSDRRNYRTEYVWDGTYISMDRIDWKE